MFIIYIFIFIFLFFHVVNSTVELTLLVSSFSGFNSPENNFFLLKGEDSFLVLVRKMQVWQLTTPYEDFQPVPIFLVTLISGAF